MRSRFRLVTFIWIVFTQFFFKCDKNQFKSQKPRLFDYHAVAWPARQFSPALCKFQIAVSLFISLETDCLHSQWIRKHLHSGTKPFFHLANLFARTEKNVGTLPTCLRRIFSPATLTNHVVGFLFSLRVAKWKIGLNRSSGWLRRTVTMKELFLYIKSTWKALVRLSFLMHPA